MAERLVRLTIGQCQLGELGRVGIRVSAAGLLGCESTAPAAGFMYGTVQPTKGVVIRI